MEVLIKKVQAKRIADTEIFYKKNAFVVNKTVRLFVINNKG